MGGELGPHLHVEGTSVVQWAGGRLHEAPSDWRRDSRLDAIAAGDRAPLDALGRTLDAAILGPEEASRRGTTIEVAVPGGGRSFDRAALSGLPDPVVG